MSQMRGISLRVPESGDAAAILDAVRESLAELQPWMTWCHPGYGIADALQWAGTRRGAAEAGDAYEFVISDAEGGLLGCCGVNTVNRENRFANLGYWVRTSQTRRGIAAEAVRRLADWAFANTDLQRLEVVVAVGNTASLRVAEKVGALREGTLRSRICVHGAFQDAVMHALLRPPEHG